MLIKESVHHRFLKSSTPDRIIVLSICICCLPKTTTTIAMFSHSLVEVTAMDQDNYTLMDLSHNSDKLLPKRETKLQINFIRISSWKMEYSKATSTNNSKHKMSPCKGSNSKCSNNNQCCPSTRLGWDQLMEITIITIITTITTTQTSFTLNMVTKKTYLLRWRAALTGVHLRLHLLYQTLINLSKQFSNRTVISVMLMKMFKRANLRHSERNTEMRCSSMVLITMMTIITVIVKGTSLLMMMTSIITTKMRNEFYSYVTLIWTNSRSPWSTISSVTMVTSSRSFSWNKNVKHSLNLKQRLNQQLRRSILTIYCTTVRRSKLIIRSMTKLICSERNSTLERSMTKNKY